MPKCYMKLGKNGLRKGLQTGRGRLAVVCRRLKSPKKRGTFCKTPGVLPGGAYNFWGTRSMTAEHNSEIRMKDLISHFTRRWKSILTVTVLCIVLLGGWQYLSVKKAHDAGELTKEEARYESEMALYQTNLENAQKEADYISGVLAERTAYRDSSLLMNLDPENVWVAEKKYLISSIEGSGADILTAYTGAMAADHEEAAIREAFGTDNPGYARELVSIASDPAENSFTISVRGADEEKARKGLAYVSGKIAEAEKIAQDIWSHTLQELNEGVFKTAYPELTEMKANLGSQILREEESATTANRNLNNVLESKPFKPGNPVVRWAITGGVMGFLVMMAIYLTGFLRKKER